MKLFVTDIRSYYPMRSNGVLIAQWQIYAPIQHTFAICKSAGEIETCIGLDSQARI